MAAQREFQVIVYGATGYTGQLVADYMARLPATGKQAVRWAMAGRSQHKLEQVREQLGAPDDTPLIVADSGDPAALDAMTQRTKVVLTTVGPYQLYGSELVAACVSNGTHYVDLCGEPLWMREMIDKHQAEAEASGAQITFSCGFDSIPFDLGVLSLQRECQQRFGNPALRIRARVRSMDGSFSGGTAASMTATMKAVASKPSKLSMMTSSFALTPDFEGPAQPAMLVPKWDNTLKSWVAPFVMAQINTKNVHRTNYLLDFLYGEDFRYEEMMVASPVDFAKQAAKALAKANPFGGNSGLKPGDGPTPEERAAGSYDVLFIGETIDGEAASLAVRGDQDPGYGSTSKMIAEAALCLAQDKIQGGGGIWTPGALMGDKLIKRLKARAGISFTVES